MSIEAAIREHYGSQAELTALVPLSKVVIGLYPPVAEDGETMAIPYVRLTVDPEDDALRTSDGVVLHKTAIQFAVHAETFDAARLIVEKLKTVFHNAEFDYSAGRVADMAAAGCLKQDSDDGVWELVQTFNIAFVQTVFL